MVVYRYPYRISKLFQAKHAAVSWNLGPSLKSIRKLGSCRSWQWDSFSAAGLCGESQWSSPIRWGKSEEKHWLAALSRHGHIPYVGIVLRATVCPVSPQCLRGLTDRSNR